MSYRVSFAKLLPRKYASDFLQGDLYLNTSAYFGKIDRTDTARFDPHDGVDESRQVKEVSIQDKNGKWVSLPVIGPVTSRSKASESLNVLSLFTMTDRNGDFFDQRNLAFGDVAVVIIDIMEFIRRVKAGAKAAGKNVTHRPVDYVEREIHDGPMGPFRKYAEHRYQNEFRFVFTEGDGTACRLPLGDIRDITHQIKASDIPNVWQQMLTMR